MAIVRAILVAACAILLALPLPQPVTAQARRQVTIGMLQEPDSLNPVFYTTLAAHVTYPFWLDPQVTFDDNWNLVPVQVESVPTVKNGGIRQLPGGKMEVTWKLRDGLTWHDGRPITAQDAVFTHKMVTDEKMPPYITVVGPSVEKVEAKDNRTVLVTFKESFAFANYGITDNFILPKHIFEPIYGRGAQQAREAPFGRDLQLTTGSGPFVLKEWGQGTHIVLDANPKYWRGKPGLDRVVIRFFRDISTLVANVVSGEIDIASPPPVGIGFAQGQQIADMVKQGRARDVRVDFRKTLVQDGLYFNTESGVLSDKRIRKAIAYSINRLAISQSLFQNGQPPAHSFVPEDSPAFSPSITRYPYDPSRAKRILEEAGWRLGPDNTRVNARGERLALQIMTTAGNATRERIEQIIQQQLAGVGIELTIRNVPSRVLLSEFFYARKSPHMVLISHNGDELFLRRAYLSSNVKPVGEFSTNVVGWRNAPADKLLDAMVGEPDDAKRFALVKQFQDIWSDEVPVLLMYQWRSAATVKVGIENFKPSGTSSNPGPYNWNAFEWKWK
jgi:peptide/nickel transport system substrate-binding protein